MLVTNNYDCLSIPIDIFEKSILWVISTSSCSIFVNLCITVNSIFTRQIAVGSQNLNLRRSEARSGFITVITVIVIVCVVSEQQAVSTVQSSECRCRSWWRGRVEVVESADWTDSLCWINIHNIPVLVLSLLSWSSPWTATPDTSREK